jgi:mannose-1-phosphate guanylyltransferase
LIALILAGGSGKRFWPLSTENKPKHFLKIFDNKSMLQITYERILSFINKDDIFIITPKIQKKLIKADLPDLSDHQIILEPLSMNTAACICYATSYLLQFYCENEVVFVFPADNFIPEVDKFKNSMIQSLIATKQNNLVVFGIKPTYPATGFGYIESDCLFHNNLFHVKQFKEKPDKDLANLFIKSSNFYWNSGIFSWNLKSILKQYSILQPKIIEIVNKILKTKSNIKKSLYTKIPNISIDIAILENSKLIVCKCDFVWLDVGNWKNFSELIKKDNNGNYFQSNGQAIDSNSNSVYSNKNIALIGVSNLVVVETKNNILILNKEDAEKVKLINLK